MGNVLSVKSASRHSKATVHLQHLLTTSLSDFPWRIEIVDWEGCRYSIGHGGTHWAGDRVEVHIKTRRAGRHFLGLCGFKILEDYVCGDIDVGGNFFLLTWIRLYLNLELSLPTTLLRMVQNRAFQFQSISRAAINVSSHYDLNENFINAYLDSAYQSYSCGIFEDPECLNVEELLSHGHGKNDNFDSLEKAQFAKFKDAADFVRPIPGERVLDIGCGYGGQLRVGAELFPDSHWVGWTHSRNQIDVGLEHLRLADVETKAEMHFGDYRQDLSVYDHILSTGMVSHVGPNGLVPYVRQVRRRIRRGGRYMHHALMKPWSRRPLDSFMGVAFNKKYVWPGFHWFSLAEHCAALERNGFRIIAEKNLRLHYSKTTAAWYLRMMGDSQALRQMVGDATFRAWQIYLAGASGGFSSGQIEVHRIYAEAI
jgi:cyclopropane-fatty-acyl-phospholipid synthase